MLLPDSIGHDSSGDGVFGVSKPFGESSATTGGVGALLQEDELRYFPIQDGKELGFDDRLFLTRVATEVNGGRDRADI